MSKRYNEPIRVFGKEARLEAFVWRQKLYRVEQVIQTWTMSSGMWQKNAKHRQFSLVAASHNHGRGVFELYLECLQKQWFLFKVVD